MAGKRKKPGVKKRDKRRPGSPASSADEQSTAEEEDGGGTMMGLRSGFKSMAGSSGSKKSSSLFGWDTVIYAVLVGVAVFVFVRYGC